MGVGSNVMYAMLIKTSRGAVFAVIMTDPQNTMRRQLLRLAPCHYFHAMPSIFFLSNPKEVYYKARNAAKLQDILFVTQSSVLHCYTTVCISIV